MPPPPPISHPPREKSYYKFSSKWSEKFWSQNRKMDPGKMPNLILPFSYLQSKMNECICQWANLPPTYVHWAICVNSCTVCACFLFMIRNPLFSEFLITHIKLYRYASVYVYNYSHFQSNTHGLPLWRTLGMVTSPWIEDVQTTFVNDASRRKSLWV